MLSIDMDPRFETANQKGGEMQWGNMDTQTPMPQRYPNFFNARFPPPTPGAMPMGGILPQFPHGFPMGGMNMMGMGGGGGSGGGAQPLDGSGMPLPTALIDLDRGVVWRQQWTQHKINDLLGGKKKAIREWRNPMASTSSPATSNSSGSHPKRHPLLQVKRELSTSTQGEDSDCQEVMVVEQGGSQTSTRWVCSICQTRDEAIVFTSTLRLERHADAHQEAGPDLATRVRQCFPSYRPDLKTRPPNSGLRIEETSAPEPVPHVQESAPEPPPKKAKEMPAQKKPRPAEEAPSEPNTSDRTDEVGLSEIEDMVSSLKATGATSVECKFGGTCAKDFRRQLTDCLTPAGLHRLKSHALVLHFRQPYLRCDVCQTDTYRIKAHMRDRHPDHTAPAHSSLLHNFLPQYKDLVKACFPTPASKANPKPAEKKRKAVEKTSEAVREVQMPEPPPSPAPRPESPILVLPKKQQRGRGRRRPESSVEEIHVEAKKPSPKKGRGNKASPAPTPQEAKEEYDLLVSSTVKAAISGSGSLYCRHKDCGKDLKAIKFGIESHVANHADVKLWRCRVCQTTSNYKYNPAHQKKCGTGTMSDIRRPKTIQSLMQTFKDTIGRVKEVSPVAESMNVLELTDDEPQPRPSSTSPVKERSELVEEPAVELGRLGKEVAEEAEGEGRVPLCALCDSPIPAALLVDHITVHWTGSGGLFGCRLCGSDVGDMVGHLSAAHGGRSEGDWVDVRGRHEPRLISLFKRCFPDPEERKVFVQLD